MGIPERLITVRTYDSPELAAEDHQALLEAGFDAYLSASHFRPGGISELRVPESQVEEALELLPPELPTLRDLNRRTRECRGCGGAVIEPPSALARYVLYAGVGLAVLALARGDVRSAFVFVVAAAAIGAFVRKVTGRLVCERCGTVWRPMHADDADEHP